MCTFVNPMWDLSNIFAIATSRIYTLNIRKLTGQEGFFFERFFDGGEQISIYLWI